MSRAPEVLVIIHEATKKVSIYALDETGTYQFQDQVSPESVDEYGVEKSRFILPSSLFQGHSDVKTQVITI